MAAAGRSMKRAILTIALLLAGCAAATVRATNQPSPAGSAGPATRS